MKRGDEEEAGEGRRKEEGKENKERKGKEKDEVRPGDEGGSVCRRCEGRTGTEGGR